MKIKVSEWNKLSKKEKELMIIQASALTLNRWI